MIKTQKEALPLKKRLKLPAPLQKILAVVFHPFIRWLIEALAFLFLIFLIFLGTAKNIPFLENQQFFVILSGSMEPTIPTGSLVLVTKNTGEPQVNEIWTFLTPRSNNIVTHRIVNKKTEDGVLMFSSKGDANDTYDAWILGPGSFIGKVKFSIPYAGYLVNFAKTPKGFFVIAVIPGLIIIIDELFNIKKIIQLEYEKKILTLKKELDEVKGPKSKAKPKKS